MTDTKQTARAIIDAITDALGMTPDPWPSEAQLDTGDSVVLRAVIRELDLRDLPPAAAPDAGAPQENAGRISELVKVLRERTWLSPVSAEEMNHRDRWLADQIEQFAAPAAHQETKMNNDAKPQSLHAEAITTFTPMLWNTLTEAGKYEEYIRIRKLLLKFAPAAPQETPEPTEGEIRRRLHENCVRKVEVIVPTVTVRHATPRIGQSADEAMEPDGGAPARAAEWQLLTKEHEDGQARSVTREISQPFQSSAATDGGHQDDSAGRNDDGD